MQRQNVNRALHAWGANPPDWIEALAEHCDASSQGAVAREIGCSAAVVNQLLGRSYKGRLDRYESRVRGQLMKETVSCPVMGEISKRDCADHQKRERDGFRATNPLRVALRKACPACPNRERKD